MPKSLADLRAAPPSARPERSLTICLRPDLVAEVQALTEELDNLAPEIDDEGSPKGPPRRQGQGEPPRAAEIKARLVEVLAEMGDHEGELRLRANWSDGDWRIWCSAHPARDKDTKDGEYDLAVTSGFCDADALVAELGAFTHSWSSDPLAADDWAAVLEPNIGQADKKALARAVVGMYEAAADFKSWRAGLSAILSRSTGSASAAPTKSASSGSTAGSRRKSSAATTERVDK